MLKVKFKNSKTLIDVEFFASVVDGNDVVRLFGAIPKNKNGFEIYRENGDILGNYLEFTSIYKELENGLEFSRADLQPWEPSTPLPEPEPPTKEEIAEQEKQKKISEVNRNITELKSQIDATDYKIIKCYEYQSVKLESPYDLKTLHEERQCLRNKINILEEEISKLESKGGIGM